MAKRKAAPKPGNRRLVAMFKGIIIFVLCLPWLIATAFGVTLAQETNKHQSEIRQYNQSILDLEQLNANNQDNQTPAVAEGSETPSTTTEEDQSDPEDQGSITDSNENTHDSAKSSQVRHQTATTKTAKKCSLKQKASADKKSAKKKADTTPPTTPENPEDPSVETTQALDPIF